MLVYKKYRFYVGLLVYTLRDPQLLITYRNPSLIIVHSAAVYTRYGMKSLPLSKLLLHTIATFKRRLKPHFLKVRSHRMRFVELRVPCGAA